MTTFGEMEVPHEHCLLEAGGGFRMSAYCQEMVSYIGQEEVFEKGSETLLKLRGIEITGKQIDRVSHYYGEELEKEQTLDIKEGRSFAYENEECKTQHYVMVDGSMALTREDGWKEIKLGRIFKASEHVAIQEGRNIIMNSTYVAHLGGHKKFFEKMEYFLTPLTQMIFVADGSKWIWNWIEETYSHAIQILDYYHAKEHLCAFALLYFQHRKKRKRWIKKQTDRLWNGKIFEIITLLKSLSIEEGQASLCQARDNLINYYMENAPRMRYNDYREKGLMIGSGPIESAHRTVFQQRMKLSGQRWTKKGLQQIVNLRAVYKSKRWDKVVKFIKKAA